jgi:hypothetical protein
MVQGPALTMKGNMKHKFTITYETDGLPICPDAIHEQLDRAMVKIKKKFATQYFKLPGLHKLYLEPCGSWFAEEQKPIRFELQDSAKSSPIGKASSGKLQASSALKKTQL